jgi:RND family efflux transporter MFP subunit
MKSLYKYIALLAIVGAGVTLFYNKVYIPKSTYERVSPTLGDLSVEVFGIGNLGAKHIYAISAGVSAKILEMQSDEGEWVKKGDLLVELDSVELPELIEEAKIVTKKASLELIASKKELESLEVQKSLFEITYRRYFKLNEQSYASQSEYDKAKTDLDVIKAQIKVTKARIESAQMEISRTKKALESLKIKLSRYKVYSPIDGYVISRDVEESQTLTPSQTIFEIVNPKSVWIKAYIDEKLSGDIRVGQSVKILLRSQRDTIYKGIVKRIVAKSDIVTQEREVDIAFENLPIPFYINEQAEVNIETKKLKNIMKIPLKTVLYNNKKPYIWINQDGKAHSLEIKIVGKTLTEIGIKDIDKDIKILVPNPKKRVIKEGMSIN